MYAQSQASTSATPGGPQNTAKSKSKQTRLPPAARAILTGALRPSLVASLGLRFLIAVADMDFLSQNGTRYTVAGQA